jgi:ribosomal protein L13E
MNKKQYRKMKLSLMFSLLLSACYLLYTKKLTSGAGENDGFQDAADIILQNMDKQNLSSSSFINLLKTNNGDLNKTFSSLQKLYKQEKIIQSEIPLKFLMQFYVNYRTIINKKNETDTVSKMFDTLQKEPFTLSAEKAVLKLIDNGVKLEETVNINSNKVSDKKGIIKSVKAQFSFDRLTEVVKPSVLRESYEYKIDDFKGSTKFTAKEMKDAGFTLDEFLSYNEQNEQSGFSLKNLIEAGFSIKELYDNGLNNANQYLQLVKDNLVDLQTMYKLFPAGDMEITQFTAKDWVQAGATLQWFINDAQYNEDTQSYEVKMPFSSGSLQEAGFTNQEIQAQIVKIQEEKQKGPFGKAVQAIVGNFFAQ